MTAVLKISTGLFWRVPIANKRRRLFIIITKFRKPVVPGDQLHLELEATGCRRGIWNFVGKAYVDGKLVTESELKATFADK